MTHWVVEVQVLSSAKLARQPLRGWHRSLHGGNGRFPPCAPSLNRSHPCDPVGAVPAMSGTAAKAVSGTKAGSHVNGSGAE